MQQNNRRAETTPVIVRAWGDEPVQLVLHRIDNNRCYVGSKESLKPIGLPVDQVFFFDPDRYSQLCTAFVEGDMRKLGELWADIPVDDFACNKYQDVLRSQHDQENITDTECIESGDAQ